MLTKFHVYAIYLMDLYGGYTLYMCQMKTLALSMWPQALYIYFTNYICVISKCNSAKWLPHCNIGFIVFILYCYIDATGMLLCAKAQLLFTWHVTSIHVSQIWLLNYAYVPYVWWAYVVDICKYMCHVWSTDINPVTLSTVHVLCKLHSILLAHFTQQTGLPHFNYKTCCLLWLIGCNNDEYIAKTHSITHLLEHIITIYLQETNVAATYIYIPYFIGICEDLFACMCHMQYEVTDISHGIRSTVDIFFKLHFILLAYVTQTCLDTLVHKNQFNLSSTLQHKQQTILFILQLIIVYSG